MLRLANPGLTDNWPKGQKRAYRPVRHFSTTYGALAPNLPQTCHFWREKQQNPLARLTQFWFLDFRTGLAIFAPFGL